MLWKHWHCKHFLMGVLSIIGSFALHISIGQSVLWGNISIYVLSYMHLSDPRMSLADANVVYVLQIIIGAIVVPVGSWLTPKREEDERRQVDASLWTPRWIRFKLLLAIGGIINIGSLFACSLLTDITTFIIVYAFGLGIGRGLWYLPPIMICWEYFPNHRGLVSGIIVTGFGLSSFLFGLLWANFINPLNEAPTFPVEGGLIFDNSIPDTLAVSLRTPKMFQLDALICVGLLVIALVFINPKPEHWTPTVYQNVMITSNKDWVQLHPQTMSRVESNDLRQPLLDTEIETTILVAKKPTAESEVPLWKWLLRLKNWHLMLMMFLSASFPYFMGLNFKSYGGQFLHDDQFISLAGSLGALCDAIGRILWAIVFDVVGFKIVYYMILVIDIALWFTIYFIQSNRTMYLIWVCLSLFLIGSHKPVFMTVSSQMYGPIRGGQVYSFLAVSYALCNIFNLIMVKQVSSNHLGAPLLFYIYGAMAVASLLLNWIFKEEHEQITDWEQRTREEFIWVI